MDKNLNREEGDEVKFTEIDVKRANIIAQTFIDKVETAAPVRIASSPEEKSSAVKIRELTGKTLGLPARMEPFTVRPLAGRFGIPIIGGIYALALLFYILGVLISHNGVSYMFLAFAMTVAFFASTLFAVQVVLDKNFFNAMFPKKTSYNVLSTIEPSGTPEYTLILGSHYDSDMDRADAFLFLKNLPHWLSRGIKGLAFLSLPILFIFSTVAVCLPSRGAGIKAFLFLFPTIFCGIAIFYLVTYFSYKKRNSSRGHKGLRGAALMLSVADYIRLHPALVPDNCRVVAVCFGSKECGAKGSEQFISQHYGRDDLLINPLLLNIEKVGDSGERVIQGDRQLKQSYDLRVSNEAFNSLKKCGLNPEFVYNRRMVTDSTPFARRGIPTTSLILRAGDNGLTDTFSSAFKGATSVTLDLMEYMRERQENYKGAVVEDLADIPRPE